MSLFAELLRNVRQTAYHAAHTVPDLLQQPQPGAQGPKQQRGNQQTYPQHDVSVGVGSYRETDRQNGRTREQGEHRRTNIDDFHFVSFLEQRLVKIEQHITDLVVSLHA